MAVNLAAGNLDWGMIAWVIVAIGPADTMFGQ